jgi:hypothetical protein
VNRVLVYLRPCIADYLKYSFVERRSPGFDAIMEVLQGPTCAGEAASVTEPLDVTDEYYCPYDPRFLS